MSRRPPVDDLRRLREFRNPRPRDLTITDAVRQVERETKKKVRSIGGVALAWETVVPPALRGRAAPVTLSRGVLTVRAADAAARFELDRFLRAGGDAALARAAGVAIKKIKIVA